MFTNLLKHEDRLAIDTLLLGTLTTLKTVVYRSIESDQLYRISPMNPHIIVKELYAVKKEWDVKRIPSFLDVSCGIGNTVLMAQTLGFDAYGLDKSRRVIKYAVCNRDKIITHDPMSYRDYDKFDVIYAYGPYSNVRMQSEFTYEVFRQIKSGSYMILNCRRDKKDFIDRNNIRLVANLSPRVSRYSRIKQYVVLQKL